MADSPYNKDGTLKNDPGRPEKPETGESDDGGSSWWGMATDAVEGAYQQAQSVIKKVWPKRDSRDLPGTDYTDRPTDELGTDYTNRESVENAETDPGSPGKVETSARGVSSYEPGADFEARRDMAGEPLNAMPPDLESRLQELNEKVDRQEKLIRKLIAMQPNDRKDFVARFQ